MGENQGGAGARGSVDDHASKAITEPADGAIVLALHYEGNGGK
jgi:hypothetical protein